MLFLKLDILKGFCESAFHAEETGDTCEKAVVIEDVVAATFSLFCFLIRRMAKKVNTSSGLNFFQVVNGYWLIFKVQVACFAKEGENLMGVEKVVYFS